MTRFVITSTIRFVGWILVILSLLAFASMLIPDSESKLSVISNIITLAIGAAILVFCPKR